MKLQFLHSVYYTIKKNMHTLKDILLKKIFIKIKKNSSASRALVKPRMRETLYACHTGKSIIKLQSDSSFKPRRSLLQLFRHSTEASQRSKQVS